MSGILPTIVFPSDILAEQARLLEGLQGTNASVLSCGSLDAATKTAWQLFYDTASGFAKEDPGFWGSTGARMDRVQSYEQELLAWQTKLSATCKLGLPLFNANPPPNAQIVQYVALAVGAVAGAYVIGQLLAFIPRPRR